MAAISDLAKIDFAFALARQRSNQSLQPTALWRCASMPILIRYIFSWSDASLPERWLSSFSLDHNPDRFEIDLHVLAATITNCAFRNRHRWNAVVNVWAFGKWMVRSHLFCMGNGYFRRSSSAESHCFWGDSYLSAETEKSFNMDCCRFSRDAPRSCGFVENDLTNRWSEPSTLF